MSAGRQLRRILDREDRKLARSLKQLIDDFDADHGGEVVFSPGTFQRLGAVRAAGRATRRRVAKVRDGGTARRELLEALDEFDEGMLGFEQAARAGFAVESAAAMRAAAAKVDRASQRVRSIREGLPR